jgi:hypothetical protein
MLNNLKVKKLIVLIKEMFRPSELKLGSAEVILKSSDSDTWGHLT